MLRLPLIVLTSISLLIGTLGVPQALHSCLMEREVMPSTTCASCTTKVRDAVAQSTGQSIEAPPCCSTQQSTRHLDAATFDGAQSHPAIPLIAIFAVIDPGIGTFLQKSPDLSRVHTPPPMLAERGRHIYLHTSVFLI